LTNSQIDRLGERLRKGPVSEADLRLLDTYRRSFAEGYDAVTASIRQHLGLEPSGRPAKSTSSILEKLQRESIRLRQIQDIAGCRLVVADNPTQDRMVEQLTQVFGDAEVIDRRKRPSHGYRAVHVVIRINDRLIEVQVRTSLQHLWAELSEKFADVVEPAIKYGGGSDTIRAFLAKSSQFVAHVESREKLLAVGLADSQTPGHSVIDVAGLRLTVDSSRAELAELLREAIAALAVQKGSTDALSG
jgi:putative GTP pyrophosphokinase